MGTDPDLFVHPERISNQLICPICTQVLENPVQTPTEHLFCEDELIEWMARSTRPLCPVTNEVLEPDKIRKPSRIILNMLGELQRYCPNKEEGCDWVGNNEHLGTHLESCTKRDRVEMQKEIKKKDEKIKSLRRKCESLEKQLNESLAGNQDMREQLMIYKRKLRVYDAFFAEESDNYERSSNSARSSGNTKSSPSSTGTESALQKILNLRELKSFQDEGKS